MGTAKMGPLIFSMALPAMISMIINALYNIVDSIFVAKYSQDALAAVSLVYPLQMLVVAIGVGTGVGVNSLIARRLGERRQEAADLAAEHGVALAVVGGIAFFILGWGLSNSRPRPWPGDCRVYSSAHSVRARRFRPLRSSIRISRSA